MCRARGTLYCCRCCCCCCCCVFSVAIICVCVRVGVGEPPSDLASVINAGAWLNRLHSTEQTEQTIRQWAKAQTDVDSGTMTLMTMMTTNGTGQKQIVNRNVYQRQNPGWQVRLFGLAANSAGCNIYMYREQNGESYINRIYEYIFI